MKSEELKAKALANLERIRAISKASEDEGRDFTDAERGEVKTLMDEARELKRQADTLDGDAAVMAAVNELGSGIALKAAPVTTPATDVATGRRKSLGERFTEDESIKGWLASKGAMTSEHARVGTSPAVGFAGLKDILTGSENDRAGALVSADYRGLLDQGAYARPLAIRDLITVGATTSDAVEFARELTVTNNAAPVPEATGTSAGTASGDVAGTKPESDLTLERVSMPVRTIAHWLPATKRALSDAAQVRTLVDNFLRYGLEEELEDQVINGDGNGENLEGVLNVSGVQAQAWATDLLTTTRKAKTKARIIGRVTPTAYVFNPADNETIDLLTNDQGNYYFGGPMASGTQSLWGLPRVESEAVPEGTGILADWRRAVLWDRESAAVQVSDSHADFFVRNLVAILAELRAAFGIIRPAAFVTIDLTAGS